MWERPIYHLQYNFKNWLYWNQNKFLFPNTVSHSHMPTQCHILKCQHSVTFSNAKCHILTCQHSVTFSHANTVSHSHIPTVSHSHIPTQCHILSCQQCHILTCQHSVTFSHPNTVSHSHMPTQCYILTCQHSVTFSHANVPTRYTPSALAFLQYSISNNSFSNPHHVQSGPHSVLQNRYATDIFCHLIWKMRTNLNSLLDEDVVALLPFGSTTV
jgi:hypothetical protein